MANFKKAATLCMAVLMTASMGTMAACESLLGGDEEVHVHTYGTEWSKDATNHWYGCTECDEGAVGKNAHAWNDGEVTTAATREAAGVKTYTCVVCGETKTEAIAQLPAYATPASGEGTTDSPYVITDGEYEEVVTYDAEAQETSGYKFYAYTATADGSLTVSVADENANVSLQINGDYQSYTEVKGDVTVPVKANDVVAISSGISWEYEWAEGETSYAFEMKVAYSEEAAEANGTYIAPYVVTVEDFEASYSGEVEVAYDSSVSTQVYYQYTVTGDDTAGLNVISSNDLTGVSVAGNNYFNLTGGYNEYYEPNSAYLPAKKGDVVTFVVQCTNYSVEKVILSFGVTETNELYEDGTGLTPYVIAAAGETYTDLAFPATRFGYDNLYFSYTATANGTLSVTGVTGMMVGENWDTVTSAEVVAGETYLITVPYDWSTGATTASPVFAFTAAA